MEILAHRGASGTAPENTIAAFKKAIIDGCDGFEFDVQQTKDGKLVVFHDEKMASVRSLQTCSEWARQKIMLLYELNSLGPACSALLWPCQCSHR